jgi:hypothetical protein
LFATDILKVLYAPHKIFKEIIQNPKYWGPLLVFILIIGAQTGFSFAQSQKLYYEQTYPTSDQLGLWTTNTTLWTCPGVTVTNNYIDYLNSTTYGNGTVPSSLQFAATDSNNVSLSLLNISSVDCSNSGFQNLSMRIKQVDPLGAPSQVTVTLYSLSDSNFFQTDLSNSFLNASLIGLWNNLTIPVGANASIWKISGNPQWTNITGLNLEFVFSLSSNITLRMEGLFFRGEYKTATEVLGSGTYITDLLTQSVFQFVLQWLVYSALYYVIIRGLKGTAKWKPLFVAIGFVLITMVIQAVISIPAISILPQVNFPVGLQIQLPGETDALYNIFLAQTQQYSLIVTLIGYIIDAWIIGLGTFVVRALQPEFSYRKCLLASAAAVIASIVLIGILNYIGV